MWRRRLKVRSKTVRAWPTGRLRVGKRLRDLMGSEARPEVEVGIRVRTVRRSWALTWPPLREAGRGRTPPLAPPTFRLRAYLPAQRYFGTRCLTAVRSRQAPGSSHQVDPRMALGIWAVCLEPITPTQNPATRSGAHSILAPDSLGHFLKRQSKKQIVQKITERGSSV